MSEAHIAFLRKRNPPRRAPVLMILPSKCPQTFGGQCHKYYGVSCGAATTKTAAKPPVPLCDSKAYSSRQGAKKQPSMSFHNTEGCYSLLLSSIIDLTSLSSVWEFTSSWDSLLFCTFIIMETSKRIKTEELPYFF